MLELAELKTKSSNKLETLCRKCHEKNCNCQNELIKIEDNKSSFKHSKSNKIKTISNSKFLCNECKLYFHVEDLIKHHGNCCFQTNDEDKGKCEYCYKIVENPTTKHLHVTNFEASECDEFCTDCPNCNTTNVKIKQHFPICPMKPKECNLSKLGCKGLIITNQFVCTLANKHEKLVEKTIKFISNKIKSFQIYNLNVLHGNEIINSMIEKIVKLKEDFVKLWNTIRIPRNGKLVWRIDNASKFLKTEKPKFSTAVYTSDFGYKLCLKTFPKGDGIGLKDYFSIFFVIMKGDYDDLLSWPFEHRIKVTLYITTISKSKHEVYKPDRSESFKKPINDLNLASGNPKFISQKDLNESGFIIEDSLFIELNIEQTKAWF